MPLPAAGLPASLAGHPQLATSLADALRRGAVGNPGGATFITMISAPWLPMMEHLLYTARRFGGVQTFLVVALDRAGLEACLTMPIVMPVSVRLRT